ncbi:hypothetical protein LCGC14_1704280 [marine sediment metagenome]|uniref:Uncharacterized protein n=1 Tax=marine sediment metagenome TaxID=412755 RepID=A0A0F9KH56_9ZZZZ
MSLIEDIIARLQRPIDEVEIRETEAEDGIRRIAFVQTATVGGGAGGVDFIPFPEMLDVNLRVFKNEKAYKFHPRLRWDIKGQEISFSLDLIEPAIVEEEAFEKVIETFKAHVVAADRAAPQVYIGEP